jgi:hypothetical protein
MSESRSRENDQLPRLSSLCILALHQIARSILSVILQAKLMLSLKEQEVS